MSRPGSTQAFRGALAAALALTLLTGAGNPLAGQSTGAPRPSAPALPGPTGWLGVALDVTTTVREAGQGREGETILRVARLYEGGPAEAAGLRPGDRFTTVNGAPVTPELFDRVVGRLAPGDPVTFGVRRGDDLLQVSLTAGQRPGAAELLPRTLQVRLDSARTHFVARLREGMAPELLARVARETAGGGSEGLLPRVQVQTTVSGDSMQVVELRIVGGVERAADSTGTGLRPHGVRGTAPAPAFPEAAPGVAWREEEGGRLVIRSDPDRVDVTLRPLAPYLLGVDRVAGARLVPLAEEMRGYFGVDTGILTAEVLPGTPAFDAGLEAGDVITRVGDEAVDSLDGLRRLLSAQRGPAILSVVRHGRTLDLRLGR